MDIIVTNLLFLEEVHHLRYLGVQVPPSILLCNIVRNFRMTYGTFPDMESLVMSHYNPCSDTCENQVPMSEAIPILIHGILTYGVFMPCSIIYQFFVFQFTEGRYPRFDELHQSNGVDLTAMMHNNVDEYWSKQVSGITIDRFPKTTMEKDHEDPCAICQEPIVSGDMIVTLPCHHVFHCDEDKCHGIQEWVRKVNACPLCKKQLV
jgi:Ring finger domain